MSKVNDARTAAMVSVNANTALMHLEGDAGKHKR